MFRGRALKEFRERNETSEGSARIFRIHKQEAINEFLMVQLEEIEHIYYESTWEYQKHPEEFYDYEWVIRVYIEEIEEMTDDDDEYEYDVSYDQSIIRLQFLPWKRGEFEWDWDDTLSEPIQTQYNDFCQKLEKWSDNDYAYNILSFERSQFLLQKLAKVGDLRAQKVLKFGDGSSSESILTYQGKSLYYSEFRLISQIEEFLGKEGRGRLQFEAENNFVVALNLKGNHLEKLPVQVKNFIHLKRLKLKINRLEKLPDWIGDLKFLEYLNLDGNNLLELPDTIGKLTALKYISLFYNDNLKPSNLPCYFESPGTLNTKIWEAQKIVKHYKNRLRGINEKLVINEEEYDVIDGDLDLSTVQFQTLSEINGLGDLKTIKSLNLNRSDKSRGNTVEFSFKAFPSLPTLEHLNMQNWNISNLQGIEHVKNLKNLDLSYNNITELGDLNRLEHLEDLTIYGNKIEEIPDLSNCKKLKFLALSGNKIKEIQNLDNCRNLKKIYLHSNEITEIKGLENLEKLEWIGLDQNDAKTIEFEKLLRNLRSLGGKNDKKAQGFVSYCKVKKLLGVPDLTIKDFLINDKRKDYVMVNGLVYFMGFDSLLGKQTLYLSGLDIKAIEGIEGLSNLKRLQDLNLKNNQISDLTGLDEIPQLESLKLGRNNISQIHGLEPLIKLKDLDLSKNNISEIKGLHNQKSLERLDLRNNKISEIRGLENLNNLDIIILDGNPIPFIDEVKKLYFKKAKILVRYCQLKRNPSLLDLTLPIFLRITEKFDSEISLEEFLPIYNDFMELSETDCVLCGKTFKHRRDEDHFESDTHKKALEAKLHSIASQSLEDVQFEEIVRFKTYCREILLIYEKNKRGFDLKTITNILMVPSEDARNFTLLLIDLLELLLGSYKEEKLSTTVIGGIKTIKIFIDSLNNEKINLINLRKVLIKLIQVIINEYKYEVEPQNGLYFLIFLWHHYSNLWDGILRVFYSSSEAKTLIKITEFIELIYIYVYKSLLEFSRRSRSAWSERPWDFDELDFRSRFISKKRHESCKNKGDTYIFSFRFNDEYTDFYENWEHSTYDKYKRATFRKKFEFIAPDDSSVINLMKGVNKIIEIFRKCFPNYIILDGDKIFVNNGILRLDFKDYDDDTFSRIQGLEKQYNLKELQLQHNNLTQIPDISFMKKLEKLDLSSNARNWNQHLSLNIEEIKHLTNLKELDLGLNNIKDIDSLEHLTKLETLNLRSNKIKDIKPLGMLINLKKLDLSDNYIKDLESLQNCINLEELDLSRNLISSIKGIEELQKLKVLEIDQNLLEDVKGLKSLPELRELSLSQNCIQGEFKIAHVDQFWLGSQQEKSFKEPQLYKLRKPIQEILLTIEYLAHDKFHVVDRILIDSPFRSSTEENAPNLQIILKEGKINSLIINCGIKEIPDISILSSLETLVCNAYFLSIPSFFKKLTSLRNLTLTVNDNTDIEFIKYLKNLEELDLHSSKLSSIEDLRELVKLRILNLNSNNIHEIPTFLRNFKSLEKLGFKNNQITFIPDWVLHLESLKEINLFGNPAHNDETKIKIRSAGLKEYYSYK